MSVDLKEFGAAEARIAALESRFDRFEDKFDALLELANKGKGAYWAGIFIATAVGSALTMLINFFAARGSLP